LRRLRQYCWGVLAIVALGTAASCSKDPFQEYAERLPRRFVVARKGYILDEHEPGVVHDDAVAYTADAGARSFNFKSGTVVRHLFVGTTDNFAALPADERRETVAVADGALRFIARLQKQQPALSDTDRQHRDVLNAFIAAASGHGK
jgi:hypothetical protein